jgi:hypothetical protein
MVVLDVSDVRNHLYLAARGAGSGQASVAMLGTWFHEMFASLLGSDLASNISAALADAGRSEDSRRRELYRHVYQEVVGPRLTRNQATLTSFSAETLAFWTAVREVCDWLLELLEAANAADPSNAEGLRGLVAPEQRLERTLEHPAWSDSVRLIGVADAVFRIPGRPEWLVAELKLGKTSPEADLGQACLYYELLQAGNDGATDSSLSEPGVGQGSLAVVSFLPQRHERVYAANELGDAREKLMDLIGKLAGVTGGGPEPVVAGTASGPASSVQVEQGRRLVGALKEYGARVELQGDPIVGPTFVRYPIALGKGVKISSIKGRSDELQLRLGLDASPIIAQTNRGQLVIDVQRPDRQYVYFSHIRDSLPTSDSLLGCSKVPIGVDLDGELCFADLAEPENCHLLVAGTTGSGKSEWLRAALAGLMLTNSPNQLELVLIDPKRNAFHGLRESPFLRCSVIYPDEHSVPEALSEIANEMDSRYHMMQGCDSIHQWSGRNGQVVPRIVVVCDEYYDVINRSKSERQAVERQIFRLGAKARASGIHLILATQQPSREVVRGALDSNIPARVGLKTASAIESRMLLGEPGAENLLGNGDLLFKDIGPPKRLQAAYLPPEERDRIFSPRH